MIKLHGYGIKRPDQAPRTPVEAVDYRRAAINQSNPANFKGTGLVIKINGVTPFNVENVVHYPF